MKLLIISALIAVSAAGRLEHLERSYLPPAQANQGSFGSSGSSFRIGFGSSGSLGSGGSSSSNGFGAVARGGSGPSAFHAGSYPGATTNQYLPPDHGPSSGSNELSHSHFGASSQGSGSQRYPSQQYASPQASQYSAPQQYAPPSTQYGTPQIGSSAHAGSSFGSHSGSSFGSQSASTFGSQSRYQTQNGATSRQYLAPKAGNIQNIPQQSFDEETGYHY